MEKNENQAIIDEGFNVDVNAYEKAVDFGLCETVDWDDIVKFANVLPNIEEEARELIVTYLGYLPALRTTIPYEPFLRALIQSYRQGQMPLNEYNYQIEEHVRLIRNADMKLHQSIYPDYYYKNYYRTFMPYGEKVRSRIVRFLGYEPKLENSVVVEMWLRDLIANDKMTLQNQICEIDYKVFTIIKYREILQSAGQCAADKSPFITKMHIDWNI